jgi:predicted dehydrogenase
MGRHHARVLAGLPGAALLAVCDQDPAAARGVGLPADCRVLREAAQLPPEARAVVVATPTPTHFALARMFLEQSRHVFVEKPFTESIEEAETLIDLARRRNLVLQAGHIERFNPAVAELVRQTSDPVFIEASRLGPFDPRAAHIGVVLDLMIHDIDIVLALTRDKVARLEAVGARLLSGHEDIVKATLHFQRGARADLTASRVTLKRFRKIRVFQKDAYLSLDYSEHSLKIFRKKKPEVKSLLDVAVHRPRIAKTDALEAELGHFLHCVREGKPPLVGGEHGRDALEIALEIRKAMRVHAL